jgi:RHS repeat-associated protein
MVLTLAGCTEGLQPEEAGEGESIRGVLQELPSQPPRDVTPREVMGSMEGPIPPTASEPVDALSSRAAHMRRVEEARAKVRRVRELLDQRSAQSETWENEDGTLTRLVHSEPHFFQRGEGREWEPIDNRLVADPNRAGWVRNAANSWQASFGPLEPGGTGGVELRHRGATLRYQPEGLSRTIYPEVQGDTVTYREVWPGADLRYVVHNSQVKEEVVLRQAPDRSRFVFESRGVPFAVHPENPGALREASAHPRFALAEPEVFDRQGQLLNMQAQPRLSVGQGRSAGAQSLTLEVDPQWLASLRPEDYPVVIDPTTTPLTTSPSSFGSYRSDGVTGDTTVHGRMGTVYTTSYTSGIRHWRSVMCLPYSTLYTNGWSLMSARVNMTVVNGDSTYSRPVTIYHASAFSYAGAVNGPVAGSGSLVTSGSVDVTNFLRNKLNEGVTTACLGFRSEEQTGMTYQSYKSFNATLSMTYDKPSGQATPVTPADEAVVTTLTPTLRVNPAPDGDDPATSIRYWFHVSTGSDAESGCVISSGWLLNTTTWTVPTGSLQDGVTYYWHVHTWDGQSSTPATMAEWVRSFRVDQRLGQGRISPMQQFGDVSVNLATGNLAVGTGTQEAHALGGEASVSLTWNSQSESGHGLDALYMSDANGDSRFNDEVFLARHDTAPSFDWAGGSPVPDVIPADNFLVQWKGFLRVPAEGQWQVGAMADDSVRIWLDLNAHDGSSTTGAILDSWVISSGVRYSAAQDFTGANAVRPITVHYRENGGLAYFKLYLRCVSGACNNPADPALAPYLGPDGAQPPFSAFRRTASNLPTRWSMSTGEAELEFVRARREEQAIVLFGTDGASTQFKQTSNGGYVSGEEAEDTLVAPSSDGSIVVHDGEGTYVFDPNGALTSYTQASDEGKASSLQYVWTSTGAGSPPRLTEVRDPVSQRSIYLVYHGDAAQTDPRRNCPTTVPVGTSFDAPSSTAISGYLCRISFWDGRNSYLWYSSGRLARVQNSAVSGVDDAGSTVTDFAYDSANRITSIRGVDASDAVRAGVRAANSGETLDIAYDTANRVMSITSPAALVGGVRETLSVTYGIAVPAGASAGVVGATGVSNSSFNASAVPASGGYSRRVTFDAAFRMRDDYLLNGSRMSTTWDAKERALTNETVSADGTQRIVTQHHYDDLGRQVAEYGPAPAACFGADRKPVASPATTAGCGLDRVDTELHAYDEGISGLSATYFGNERLAGQPLRRTTGVGMADGSVAANWGVSSPGGNVPADGWSLRLSGQITFPETGNYVLATWACGGTRIFIDDVLVMNSWTEPGDVKKRSPDGTFNNTVANSLHRIRVDYFEKDTTGSACLELHWSRPNGTYGVIPGSFLATLYGLETSTTDELGRVTRLEYGTNNSLAHLGLTTRQLVTAGGVTHETLFTYEPQGTGHFRQTSRTAAGGNQYTTAYWGDTETPASSLSPLPCGLTGTENQAGNVRFRTFPDPDGAGALQPIKKEFVYDNSGNVRASRTMQGTSVSEWTCAYYDQRNRLTQETVPAFGGAAARTVTHNHAVGGNPLVNSISDANGTVTETSDLLGRTVRYVDVTGRQTDTTYDTSSRLLDVTTTGLSKLTHIYNEAGRLTQLQIGGSVLATLTYDANDRLIEVAYPSGTGNSGNGTRGTFTYDWNNRMQSVTWYDASGAVLSSNQVTSRDSQGRVLDELFNGVDANPSGNNYAYDGLGRLITAYVSNHRYDYFFEPGVTTCGTGTNAAAGRNGNRTKMTDTVGTTTVTTTYCYDFADRLVSSSLANLGTVAYDMRGNATSLFGEQYAYDGENRHIRTVRGGTTVDYARDATDRIIRRTVSGTASESQRFGFTADGDSADLVLDATNNIVESYLSLPGGVLVTQRVGSALFSYPNLHGDTVAVLDGSGGGRQGPFVYDPFGNRLSATAVNNTTGSMDYGWLGQYQRATEQQAGFMNMVEMGARLYSPLLGRFLGIDPVEGGTENDYVYVNDPRNDYDLTGTRSWWRRAWDKVKNSRTLRKAWKHRGAILGFVSAGVCAATAGVGCVVASAVVFANSAGTRIYNRHKSCRTRRCGAKEWGRTIAGVALDALPSYGKYIPKVGRHIDNIMGGDWVKKRIIRRMERSRFRHVRSYAQMGGHLGKLAYGHVRGKITGRINRWLDR